MAFIYDNFYSLVLQWANLAQANRIGIENIGELDKLAKEQMSLSQKLRCYIFWIQVQLLDMF